MPPHLRVVMLSILILGLDLAELNLHALGALLKFYLADPLATPDRLYSIETLRLVFRV